MLHLLGQFFSISKFSCLAAVKKLNVNLSRPNLAQSIFSCLAAVKKLNVNLPGLNLAHQW